MSTKPAYFKTSILRESAKARSPPLRARVPFNMSISKCVPSHSLKNVLTLSLIFFYGSFHNVASTRISDYSRSLICRMTVKGQIGKDLEGRDLGLIEVQSRSLFMICGHGTCLDGLSKTKIADFAVEMRAEYHPNTGLEPYHYPACLACLVSCLTVWKGDITD